MYEKETVTLKDLKNMIDFAIRLRGEDMKVAFLDSSYIYHPIHKSIGIVKNNTIVIGEPDELFVDPLE